MRYRWCLENRWNPTLFYTDEKMILCLMGTHLKDLETTELLKVIAFFFTTWNKVVLGDFLHITNFMLRIFILAKITKILMNTIYHDHGLKEWQKRKSIIFPNNHICAKL